MDDALERATMSRVTRRLIPFLFTLYIFNYLDRVNVSIAALTMKRDLALSDAAYGWGVGAFFVGYVLFEVPSNLALERFGPRRWIARIMISWGVISSCMMFARDSTSLCALRFLLGVAEAGFFPGMVIYLTYWFPANIRARAAARFMVATTVSGIVGGPLGATIMKLDGTLHLAGWQWLFLLEGIPSFILGLLVLAYLADRPQQAKWLPEEERRWLVNKLAHESTSRLKRHNPTISQALRHPRVLHLCLLFFLTQACGYGLGYWSPLLLKSRSDWSNDRVLWLGALPGIVGVVSMIVAATSSDRLHDRRLHIAFGLLVGAIGMSAAALAPTAWLTLAAFAFMAVGTSAANGPFWAACTSFLTGTAAAGSIALINSVGNLGGLAGPVLVGFLKQHTSGYKQSLFALAVIETVAFLVALKLPAGAKEEYAEPGGEGATAET